MLLFLFTNFLPKMLFFLFLLFCAFNLSKSSRILDASCSLQLVETIPIGVNFSPKSPKQNETGVAWLNLLNEANTSIDIGSYYWTLKGEDVIPDSSAATGEAVFSALRRQAHLLRIAMNAIDHDADTEELINNFAEVRQLNMTALVGAGVLHTKFLIIDKKHFYVGSANMDWRSLSQVKELGIVGSNCPLLAEDLSKIFDVYWRLGGQSNVPNVWPPELSTEYNINTPASISDAGIQYSAFFSSSPDQFSPHGRTNDLNAVKSTIQNAQDYVHIAVMDYFPLFIYSPNISFWPSIDNELRDAYVTRGVNVKLLVSKWKHTRKSMLPFLRSLQALNGLHKTASIQVKWFTVPTNETLDRIPFARVNHNKYMVTENAALIGTSNWSADYFTNTAGVSLVLSSSSNTQATITNQLRAIFERDWNSEYAADCCSHESRTSLPINANVHNMMNTPDLD